MESNFVWSCGRKKKYNKKISAEEKLKRGQRSGHYDSRCHVYHCTYCLNYHIGHRRVKDLKIIKPKRHKVKIGNYEECWEDMDFFYIKMSNSNKYKLMNEGWVLGYKDNIRVLKIRKELCRMGVNRNV